MKIDFDRMTKDFILNEGQGPQLKSWVQALEENIRSFKPSSVKDHRRLEVMKHQIREIRRSSRRLQEQVNVLEEQLQILQEEKNGN
jgi:SMC interacting uncharacterized protein involved in chromosome segregation